MFKMQMATSCGWKMSTSPNLRQSAGSALDRLRCVGHSPIQQHGDTIRNVAKTVSKGKMKMDKSSLTGMPNAVHFKSLKNSDIFLLSIDTRCTELRPVSSSCLSQCSTTHWASYSSSDLQLPSTASQDSCATRTRTRGRSQTKRENYRQQEMDRKPTIRIRRNSLKPGIPVVFQEPKISQCAGITPVSTKENPVKFHEVKIRTPVFRQHYEVMFQEAPWRPLRSSSDVRPLTISSCRTSKPSSRTQRANLTTAPSSICLEVPCSTPNTLQLQLEGLRLHGAWVPSSEDKGLDTHTLGRMKKDLKLVTAERVSEAGDDGKWKREYTRESTPSDPVSPNESTAGSTRWDPGQFKVTVTKIKRQSRT